MGFLEPHGRGRPLFRHAELSEAAGIGSAGVPPACGPEARGPVIVVHSLPHAVAALEAAAGRRVVLASAPDAGIYGGPGWWREMIAAARNAVPAAQYVSLLDCGDDAGAAQAAVRAGVEAILFTGRPDVAERLADIARQRGARLATERPIAPLDLGETFFAAPAALRRRCADFLRRAALP